MTCSVWCNGMSQILRVSRRHGAVAAVISAIIFNKYCNSSQICSLRSVQLRTHLQSFLAVVFTNTVYRHHFSTSLPKHVILVSGQIETFGKKKHPLCLVQVQVIKKANHTCGLLGYYAESKNC